MTTFRIINNKYSTGPCPFILIDTKAQVIIGAYATLQAAERKIKDIRGRGATK